MLRLVGASLRIMPFIDGNKRMGVAAMVTLLDLNRYGMTCSEEEETAMVLRAASSECSEDEWTAWLERSVACKT